IRCPVCGHAFTVQQLATDNPGNEAATLPPRPSGPAAKAAAEAKAKPNQGAAPAARPGAARTAVPKAAPKTTAPKTPPPKDGLDTGLLPIEDDKPAAKAAAETPKAPPAKKPHQDDEDEGIHANPYGVTTLDLTPRCPHCANEMVSEEAIICVYCGYNTQ